MQFEALEKKDKQLFMNRVALPCFLCHMKIKNSNIKENHYVLDHRVTVRGGRLMKKLPDALAWAIVRQAVFCGTVRYSAYSVDSI